MKERLAACINILSEFCGKRDIPALTSENLYKICGIRQADVMVLFGGSILCGGDVLAEAMKENIAKRYLIVGGAGHTTETLRQKMQAEFPSIQTAGLSEAEIFEAYLESRHGLHADFLECRSTNCGNNITNMLSLLEENRISFQSIILSQDATMQRRMDAGLRKYVSGIKIINFSTYRANVIVKNAELQYANPIWGMWDMNRYITLLLGEIPRLADTADGYGPLGKNFISHVDIPPEVSHAFSELKKQLPGMVREANPQYASE